MRANKPLLHSDITASIIDSFFDVHKELGFGFREYIYARALERLLIAKGHGVEREVAVMVYFRGEPLAYERMDMLVDGAVVIENRAREPQKSALLSRLLRKSVQATKPAKMCFGMRCGV
jgi:GxxExxY protein